MKSEPIHYSVYLHLKALGKGRDAEGVLKTTPLADKDTVYRQDIMGETGQIYGQPDHMQTRHACLIIRESDETFGSWHLRSGTHAETVKVRGPLASNDGECVLRWALDGHGIAMRSGQLQAILTDWNLPDAKIYAVFQSRKYLSAKTRALVDFLLSAFEHHRTHDDGVW